MALKCVLFASAFMAVAFAGPISFMNEDCARYCPETTQTAFEAGKTYEYSYGADMKTSIPGTTGEHSSLHLAATVNVEALAPCEMVLYLTQVSLQDSDPSQYDRRKEVPGNEQFRSALQRQSLRFSFVDGHVEELCSEDEEAWVLNIKRGILSGFQNTMENYQTAVTKKETDVIGTCDVTYTPTGSTWSNYKVKKVKDVMSCIGHQSINTLFQSTAYMAPSKIQSLPIVKSTHECEQEVTSSGRLVKTTCSETHLMRPFAKEGSSATTEASYTLTFQRESSGVSTAKGAITKRASLVFDNTPSEEEETSNKREAMNVLRELCEETSMGVRPETPNKFNQLIGEMRKLNPESLTSMYKSASTVCEKAEKYLRDALPNLGTTGSVSLMSNLVLREDVSGLEADIYLTSMAFISQPNKDMLREAKPLVETPVRKSALSVSALVHTYCRENPECSKTPEVQDIVRLLGQKLSGDCSGEHEPVLMALKAIGNAGHAETLVPTLNRCFKNAENSMEIRVAAINAFRRMACTAEKDELISMMELKEADPELRIGAYLALMQCPSRDVIRRVRAVLQNEEVNQVGSFIWTHLTNLMETSSPVKQQIRFIIESESLKKTFDLDKRKFSRNIEWSMFSEMLNVGAMVDSNVIWSPKSFVPRSAMVNLTVDMFGQSVNLLEVGGRVEGIDRLLEKLFAESGSSEGSAGPDMSKLDDQFKEAEEKPLGSYYMRIFGNEIRYDDFHSLDLTTLTDEFKFLDWLVGVTKEYSWEFTKNFNFMNTTSKIPTLIGMPLVLAMEGTANIDLKASGKMDLAPKSTSVDVAGAFLSSGAVTLKGSMGIDGTHEKTSVSHHATFHSNNNFDFKFQVQNGKILNIEVNMPQDKVELVNVQSKFFITYRGVDREQNMLSQGRIEARQCLGGSMVKATGLELCGEISLPPLNKVGAPWFPMTGPTSLSLILHKRDTFTSYQLSAKALNKDRAGMKFEVDFNTPGSRIDRHLNLGVELDAREKELKMKMISPWKKATFIGSITNTNKVKRATARMVTDDTQEYDVTADMRIESNKFNVKYTPSISVLIPGKSPYTLDGSVLYREGKRADIEFALKNVMRSPAKLKGEVRIVDNKKQLRYQTDLMVKSSIFNGQVEGFVDKARGGKDVLTTRLEVNYNSKDKVVLNHKWRNLSAGNRIQYSCNSAVSSTAWPEYDMDYDLDLTKQPNNLNINLDAGLTGAKRKRITVSHSGSVVLKNKIHKITSDSSLKLPAKSLNMEFKLDHQFQDGEIKTDVMLKTTPKTERALNMLLKKESASPLKLSADIGVTIPGREMSFVNTFEQTGKGQYQNVLNVKPDKNYGNIILSALYKMSPRHEISGQLSLPSLMVPIDFEAYLSPEIRNLQSHAKVGYEHNFYSVDANWVYKRNQFNTNFDLLYPSRHVIMESEGSQKGSTYTLSMNTQWDAERDATKMFKTDAEIIVSPESPAFQVKTQWWPRQFVEVSGSLKNDLQTWWHPTRDLEGNFDLKTSFSGLEEGQVAFNHHRTDVDVTTHGEVSISGQKIEGDYNFKKLNGWSNVEATFELKTPFSVYRHGMQKVFYNFQPNGIISTIESNWNDQKVVLDLSGTVDRRRHIYEGATKLTSTFTQPIAVSSKHSLEGETYKTTINANYGKNLRMNFNMNHARNGIFITNSGDLIINIPSTEPYSLTWNHMNNQRGMRCHAELEIANDKSVFDLDAKLRKQTDIKSTLKSPFTPDIELIINHEGDMSDMKTTVQVGCGSNVFQLDNELNFEAMKTLNVQSKLSTPYTEMITVNLNNRMESGDLSGSNELKWGQNKKISIDGTLTHKMPTFEGQLKVTSPYMDDIELYGNNRKEKYLWVIDGHVKYSGVKISDGQLSLGLNRMKKFSMDLKEPAKMSLDLQHKGDLRNFETKVEFDYESTNTLEVELDVNTEDLKDMKAELVFSAPFFRNMRAIMSHKQEGSDRYQTDANLELPNFNYKHTVTNTIRATSLTDFDTQTKIAYGPGQDIELETYFNGKNPITGGATFRSPFTSEKKVEFRHEGSLTNFKSSAEIMLFEPKMTLDVEHRGDWNSFNNKAIVKVEEEEYSGAVEYTSEPVKAKVTLNIPEEYSVEITHRGDVLNFNNEVNIEMGGETITGQSSFKLDGYNLQASVSGQTPYVGYKQLNANLVHRGKWWNFKNELTGKIEDDIIKTKASLKIKDGVESAFLIETPFNKYRRAGFNFNHEGQMNNFANALSMFYGTKTMKAASSLQIENQKVEASVSLETPFKQLESIGARFTHEGGLLNFANELTAYIMEDTVTVTSTLAINGNNMESTLRAEAPILGFPKVGISASHNGPLHNFNNQMNMYIGDDNIEATSNLRFMGDALVGRISIDTPFQKWDKMRFTINHEGQKTDFSNTVELLFVDTSFKGSSSFRLNGNDLDASIEVETPFSSYTKMGAKVSHKGKLTSFDNEFSAFREQETILKSLSSVQLNGDNLEASANIQKPSWLAMAISIDHKGPVDNFGNVITASLGDQSLKSTTSMRWIGNDLEATVNIETPFSIARNMGAKLTHRGGQNNFDNEMSVYNMDQSIKSVTTFTTQGYTLHGSFKLLTPFTNHQEMGLTVDHDGKWNDFKSSFNAFIMDDAVKGRGAFKLGDKSLESSGELETPFTMMRKIGGSANHRGSITNFNNHFTAYLEESRIESTNSFEINDDNIDASVELLTPFNGYRKMGLTANHDGKGNDFKSSFNAFIMDDVVKGRGAFKLGDKSLESSGELETPFTMMRKIGGSANHRGSITNFNNHFTAYLEESKIESTNSFEVNDNSIEASVELLTPFNGYRKMGATVEHAGTILDFHNKFTAFCDAYIIENVNSITHEGNKIVGSFILEKPVNVGVTFSHEGTLTDFEQNFSAFIRDKIVKTTQKVTLSGNFLRIPYEGYDSSSPATFQQTVTCDIDGTTYTINNYFETTDTMLTGKGELIKGSTTLKMIEFTHKGSVYDFSNSGKLVLGENTYTSRSEVAWRGESFHLDAAVQINEKEYSIVTDHEGVPKDFTNSMTIGFNGQSITGSSSVKLGDEITVVATINTPFPKYETLSLKLSHQGDLTNLNDEFELNYFGKITKASVELGKTKKEISGKVDIDTPWRPLRSFTLKFNHGGKLTNFKNRGSVVINGKKFRGSSEMKLYGSKLRGAVTIFTPEEYSLIINHKGDKADFNNNLRITLDQDKINADTVFKAGKKTLEGSFDLKSPYEGYENWGLEMRHALIGGKLRTSGKLTTPIKGYKKFGYELSHDGNLRDLKTTGKLEMPGKAMTMEVTHQGTLNDFSTNVITTFNKKEYTCGVTFKTLSDGIEGTMTFATPPCQGNVNINHRGAFNDFTNSATMNVNGKSYEAGSNFKLTQNKVEGGFNMKTPLSQYQKFGITLSHEGGWDNFRGSGTVTTPAADYVASVTHRGDIKDFACTASLAGGTENYFDGSATFKMQDQVIDGNVQTAFMGKKPFTLTFNHKGNLKKFETSASLSSPMQTLKNVNIQINHNVVRTGFSCNALIKVNGKRMSGDITLRARPETKEISANVQTPFLNYESFRTRMSHSGDWNNFKSEITLSTPFSAMRDSSLEVTHTGRLSEFKTGASAKINGKELGGEVTFKLLGTTMEFSTNVRTPFSGHNAYSLSVNHNGEPNSLTTTASLKTPSHDSTVTVTHSGQSSDFNTKVVIDHDGKTAAGEVTFKMADDIESSLTVNTPFPEYKDWNINMKHSFRNNRMTSTVDLSTPVSGYERFGLELKHSGPLNNFQTSLSVSTPFEAYRSNVASITHQGTLDDFTTSFSVDVAEQHGDGEISYKRSYSRAENTYEGHIKVNAPFNIFKDAGLTFSHTKKSAAASGSVLVTYNGVKHIDIDYDMGSSSNKNANINIRAPKPLTAAFDFDNNGPDMNGNANINWENMPFTFTFGLKNQRGNRGVTLSATLPRRTISLSSEYEISSDKLAHKSEIQWGNGKAKKLAYDLEVSRTVRNKQNTIYDGQFNIQSNYLTFGANFNHKCNSGRRYVTEINIDTGKTLSIRHDLLLSSYVFKNLLKIQHPSLTQDVLFAVEGTLQPGSIIGKINLEFADQKMEMTGKIADESSGDNTRYVAEWHLTHPGSFLDVQVTSHLGDNSEALSGDMEVKYLTTRDRVIKTMNIRSEINKLREELNMEMLTPMNQMRVSGKKTSDVSLGTHHISVSGNMDDQSVSAEVDVNHKQPSLNIEVQYDPQHVYHVSGQYVDPSHISLEAYRQQDGERIQDAQIALRLNNSRLLTARAYLRPTIVTDIKEFMARDFGVQEMFDEVCRTVSEEWQYKSSYIARSARPLIHTLESIHEFVATKLSFVTSRFSAMYRNNDLYIRDIAEALDNFYVHMKTKITTRSELLLNILQEKLDEMKHTLNAMTPYVSSAYENIKVNSVAMVNQAQQYKEVVNDFVKRQTERVRNHPYVQAFLETASSVKLIDYANMVVAEVTSYVEEMDFEYIQYYWNMVSDRPEIQKVISWVENVVNTLKDAYNFYEIEKTALNVWSEIKEWTVETAYERMYEWVMGSFDTGDIKFQKWDANKGDFQMEIRMPVYLRDFHSVPTFDFQKEISYIWGVIKKYKPTSDWSVWDSFYQYKPSSNPRDWIPPFTGHAAILGSQHYMTFDKTFYEFSGECSYLLARDFIDGKFSVIVNYDNVNGEITKKSLTVASGTQEVEIMSDYKVIVNGKQTEMPYVADKTSIVRIGNKLRIDNEHGVTVTCDLAHDLCSVNVSGWYYGKTGGLFGTYDNEPSDDFTTSDHRVVTRPEELASSWTVGRRCRTTNNARTTELDTTSREYKTCAKYFEENSSPFRVCFKQVDNKPFMQMCVNDLTSAPNTIKSENICNVAAFYVDDCKRQGVPLRMPTSCVTCDLPTGERQSEGEESRLDNSDVPQSADVVLVISHRDCNKRATDSLQNMVGFLQRNLLASGMRYNRFGLVGFGGEGVTRLPHSHTMDGQLFNRKDKMVEALESFQRVTPGYTEDPLAAIEFAARYPFRAGVSKTVVVVPCESCTEQAVSYSELQQLLSTRDIHLHVLMEHNFKYTDGGVKTKHVIGTDQNAAYTVKHASDDELVGDRALRHQLVHPKDLCTALSEETDGSVFNIKKLLESSEAVQKRYLDVMTRLVSKKAKPSECQICECTSDHTGSSLSVCRSCYPTQTFKPWVSEMTSPEADVTMGKDLRKSTGNRKPKQARMLRRKQAKGRRRQEN